MGSHSETMTDPRRAPMAELKHHARALLRHGLVASGADRLARRWLGGRGIILMLHRVRDQQPAGWEANPGLTVTAQQVGAMIDLLRDQGYELVTLDQACARMTTPKPSAPRFACLTFDDGYADNAHVLLPVLAQRQAPALIYVATGCQDGQTVLWELGVERLLQEADTFTLPLSASEPTWPTRTAAEKDRAFCEVRERLLTLIPGERREVLHRLEQRHAMDFMALTRQEMLTWEQMRSLAKSGWITFGAHGVSHTPLSRLESGEVEEEMSRSRRRLEQELACPVVHFAYPYGTLDTVSRREPALAARCGFQSAVLSWGGVVQTRVLAQALPRIAFSQKESLEDLRLRISGLATLRGTIPSRYYGPEQKEAFSP